MRGNTHTVGGILIVETTLLLTKHNTIGLPETIMLVSGLVGSLLPDIDHQHSKISNSSGPAKLISMGINTIAGHRGFTHTLLFVLLSGWLGFIVTYFIPAGDVWLPLGVVLGCISHMILDTLNPTGIMWLYPASKKYIRLAKIYTGSLGEKLICFIMTGTAIFLATRFSYELLEIPEPLRNIHSFSDIMMYIKSYYQDVFQPLRNLINK